MKEKIEDGIIKLGQAWEGFVRIIGIVLRFVLNLIKVLLIIALLIYITPRIIDFLTPDTWTLFVCESKLNKAECYDNSYEIPGFKTKKDCILEGASRFSKEGFECGSNCKVEYGLNICKEVCNSSGCRK